MDLWNIVKKVGATALNIALPGSGSLVLGAINAVLPDDKQLPVDATGQQAMSAISSLPPEQQASLMEKQFDIDITEIKESHATVRAMLESDANNPQSTRPYIAKQSFHVIAFTIIVTVSIWAVAIWRKDAESIKAITDGWPFVLSVLGPLVGLLWNYFGKIQIEARERLNAASGGQASGPNIASIIAGLIKR